MVNHFNTLVSFGAPQDTDYTNPNTPTGTGTVVQNGLDLKSKKISVPQTKSGFKISDPSPTA